MYEKMILKIFILMMCLTNIVTVSLAGVGTQAGDFLKIPAEARGAALGKAVVATANGAGALAWNPAGLGFSDEAGIVFSYNQWIQDIDYGFVGVNSKPTALGTFGIGVNYLASGKIDGYDGTDTSIGDVSAQDTAFLFGYSLCFMDTLSLGVKYKYINQNLDGTMASGSAVDAGIIISLLNEYINIGCVLENLASTEIQFEEEKAKLEKITKIGIAHKRNYLLNKKLILSVQQDFEEDGKDRLGLGLELEINQMLVIRTGYEDKDIGNGISGGFGINLKGFTLDYAISDYGEFNYTHILSLRIKN